MDDFIKGLVEKAKSNPKKIAFSEGTNVDILKTAEQLITTGVGVPLLIGNKEEIEKIASENNIKTTGFEYFDNSDEVLRKSLGKKYTERFDNFSIKSVIRKTKDPVRCSMFLLKLNMVDGVAAGKEYSTGEVIFEAINIVGMQEGVESVSSIGIADIPGFNGPEGTMLGLADCAITAQPDAKDLAGIAIASADTVKNY